jgi:tetratricopeptide (TPR) repeat protein
MCTWRLDRVFPFPINIDEALRMSARDDIASLTRTVDGLPASEYPHERARVLAALALQYAHAGLPLDGLDTVRETLMLAKSHDMQPERAQALSAAAMCHRSRGDFLMAIACGIDAYHAFAAGKDFTGMGHVLTTLGATCRELGACDLGEEVLRGCLNIAARSGDRFLEARARNALGLTFADLQRFDEAEGEMHAARQILIDGGVVQHVSTATGNLGTIQRRRGEAAIASGNTSAWQMHYRSAIVLLGEALQAAVENKNKFEIADKTGSIGQSHFLLGEIDAAKPLAEVSLSMGYELAHTRLIVEGELLMARIEMAVEQYDRARERLRIAIEKSRNAELRALQRESHIHMAAIYRNQNQPVEADAHLALAREIELALSAANTDAEREVRAMWLSDFSRHPLIEAEPPLKRASGAFRAP